MPSSTKSRRIRSAAALFLAKYPEMFDAQCRFDLLIINHGRIFGVGRIAHLKMLGNKPHINLTDDLQNVTLAHTSPQILI
jgi:Holliday junction resolvase-like predicted endonuclease